MDAARDAFLEWVGAQTDDVEHWLEFLADVKDRCSDLHDIFAEGPLPTSPHPTHPRVNRVVLSFEVIGLTGDPKRLEVELPDPCVLRGLPGVTWTEVVEQVIEFAETELTMLHDALADPGNPANPFGYRGELVRRFRDGETAGSASHAGRVVKQRGMPAAAGEGAER